jgi:hypothetical protein
MVAERGRPIYRTQFLKVNHLPSRRSVFPLYMLFTALLIKPYRGGYFDTRPMRDNYSKLFTGTIL